MPAAKCARFLVGKVADSRMKLRGSGDAATIADAVPAMFIALRIFACCGPMRRIAACEGRTGFAFSLQKYFRMELFLPEDTIVCILRKLLNPAPIEYPFWLSREKKNSRSRYSEIVK